MEIDPALCLVHEVARQGKVLMRTKARFSKRTSVKNHPSVDVNKDFIPLIAWWKWQGHIAL